MAAKNSELWKTVSLHPLLQPLDTRSRPADLPPGTWRWKLNWQMSLEGKLCRRGGHQRFYSDAVSYVNQDYHHQNLIPRKAPTLLFASTSSDGTERLWVGTQSNIALLDEVAGDWTTIFSGKGADGTRFRAAELTDKVLFTNNYDNVCYHDYTTGATQDSIPALTALSGAGGINVTKAFVIVQYAGFILLMNLTQDGVKKLNRIVWCDLNDPLTWKAAAGNLASFQDLDPGDEILAATVMMGRLYIFTRRSIWWMQANGQTVDNGGPFTFVQIYSEPKNETGCLRYPNTLVSLGTEVYYLGGDSIYRFDPYLPSPVSDDWLRQASGLIYRKLETQLDINYCQSPVGEYVPDARELWFSWPTIGASGINNWCLVNQIEKQTSDIVDTGYTALTNYRRTPSGTQACNEAQDFVGASGEDFCLKSLGGVFYREYALLPETPTDDIPTPATYETVGYDSGLRAIIPLGLTDRDKKLRKILLDCDVSYQTKPCLLRLRIGDSASLMDVNDPEDSCAPRWIYLPDKLLACPDSASLKGLVAKKQRVNVPGIVWKTLRRGRFLYLDLTITNPKDASGNYGLAQGADVCLTRLDFQAMAMPLPNQ